MHALLIPFGTAGDVYPFLGVAVALRRRAHRVTVFTDSAFEDIVRRNDLEFDCLSTPEEHAELLQHPDLWHPTRSYPLIFNRVVAPKIRPVFDFITRTHVPGQTVVVAANLAVSARAACEKWNIPFVSLYVSPMCLPSYLHPARMPGLDLFPGRPQGWLKILSAAAHWRVNRMLLPPLRALCKEQGVPPPGNVMDWWHSPESVIGLFPEWFAEREAVWPAQTHLTNFPLYDTGNVTRLPTELETFLQAGSAPIVFVPSSYMAQAGNFLKESVDACLHLNRRGILLTQFTEQMPDNLPGRILSFRFAPLSQLLSRSAAIVHQGGIGTLSLALAAGVPQLAVPMGMDQHANAERLMKLGTSAVMDIRQYRGDRLAAQIKRLTEDNDVRIACRKASQRLEGNCAAEDASDLIEAAFQSYR